jgi:Cell division protein FtsI/penicillin-binding protein 2
MGGMLLLAILLVIRLAYIQLINTSYKNTAANNVMKFDVVYPARGLIFDRHGNIIVENQISYDIMITPRELKAFDTTEFCQIFELRRDQLISRLDNIQQRRRQIGYQSAPFIKQVSAQQHARFQEAFYKFPGFSAQARTIRAYPRNVGGNLLGYLVEVDSAFLRRNLDYQRGDYTGRSGIEASYESYLKGRKGHNVFLRDVHNRIKSSYDDGALDLEALPGKDLITTIDASLQEFGERIMQNKVGSIVAIEPQTGEILCMVSSPGIDVSQLANISSHFGSLSTDPLKPMFNRASMSAYPPGSVFKMVNGLIGLQEGVITTQTRYNCNMGYPVGRGVGCHAHPSPVNVVQSIQMSCNAYYCYTFRAILDNKKYPSISESFNAWRDYVASFGFGQRLGSDIPAELGGNLPSSALYDRVYGKKRWHSLTVISLAIGQGEMGATPLQLANLAAIMANRGYYITPHMVREIKDTLVSSGAFSERHYTKIDPQHFEPIVEGMYLAVNGGAGSGATAWRSSIPGIDMCGKTGTAENPAGKDHSVFICFAPRDNPKIALMAYVEHGGSGSSMAAPISSLMVEHYLRDSCTRPELLDFVLQSNLMHNFIKK